MTRTRQDPPPYLVIASKERTEKTRKLFYRAGKPVSMLFIYPMRTFLQTTGSSGLDLALVLLLVGAILVLAEIEHVPPQEGPGMVEEHEEIQEDEAEGHDGADPHDALAVQGPADVDGGEGEADVGEDEGPPVEAEAEGLVDGEVADDGDGEEPQRQAPDEDGGEQGDDAHDLLRDLVGPEVVVAARPLVREPDDGQRREAGRAHGDEHARAGLWRREAVVDHASHVARVHAHRDHHAQALGREPAEEHRHGVVVRLVLQPGRRDRAAQHEREDGQIPRGRHVLDLEPRVREQQTVHADGDDERRGEVRPEQHAVDDHQPIPAGGDGVLGHPGNDAGKGQERRREEE